MGGFEGGASWFKEFINRRITSTGSACLCVDLSGTGKSVWASAPGDDRKINRCWQQDLFHARKWGDHSRGSGWGNIKNEEMAKID